MQCFSRNIAIALPWHLLNAQLFMIMLKLKPPLRLTLERFRGIVTELLTLLPWRWRLLLLLFFGVELLSLCGFLLGILGSISGFIDRP